MDPMWDVGRAHVKSKNPNNDKDPGVLVGAR